MVRTRNKAAHGSQTAHTLDFCVNRRLVLTQRGLIHTSHAKKPFTILFAGSFKLIAPNTHLNGKQNVHTVFYPCGDQLVYHAVAVKGDDIDPVLVAQVVALLVMLGTQFIKK